MDDARDDGPIPAGDFSAWLASMREAIAGRRDADVPCGTCTACCRSSQFVTIGPDETDALAHIPKALLFPAPLRPRGHVVMGYDAHGRCPMLGESGCTIYEHRPRTCRTYDCRVFPATGVSLGGEPEKAAIARRARRWVFSHPGAQDVAEHDAVRARAADLVARDGARVPATQIAVAAVEGYGPQS